MPPLVNSLPRKKPKPDSVGGIIALALAFLAGFTALSILNAGEFRASGRSHALITRTDDPIVFWASIAWVSVIAITLGVTAFLRLRR
jgi:hypothetical protein